MIIIELLYRTALFEGRPALLYKSLPSLVLPAGDNVEEGRQKMLEIVAAGPAVIPLKETLARRLSASMDCLDAAGDNEEKLASSAAAAAAATTTSETQLGVDEPGTQHS